MADCVFDKVYSRAMQSTLSCMPWNCSRYAVSQEKKIVLVNKKSIPNTNAAIHTITNRMYQNATIRFINLTYSYFISI